VRCVREADYPVLLDILLKPPQNFTLILRHDTLPVNLHTAVANNLPTVKGDTSLHFTYNQSILKYSVYELQQAAKLGPNGLEPGVQALVRMLGMPPREETDVEEEAEKERVRRRGGRPREMPTNHPNLQVVLASGEVGCSHEAAAQA
jgi:hypothetical protein